MMIDGWPEALRPLVSRYGDDVVHQKGQEALSFPPEWSHTHREWKTVWRAVTGE